MSVTVSEKVKTVVSIITQIILICIPPMAILGWMIIASQPHTEAELYENRVQMFLFMMTHIVIYFITIHVIARITWDRAIALSYELMEETTTEMLMESYVDYAKEADRKSLISSFLIYRSVIMTVNDLLDRGHQTFQDIGESLNVPYQIAAIIEGITNPVLQEEDQIVYKSSITGAIRLIVGDDKDAISGIQFRLVIPYDLSWDDLPTEMQELLRDTGRFAKEEHDGEIYTVLESYNFARRKYEWDSRMEDDSSDDEMEDDEMEDDDEIVDAVMDWLWGENDGDDGDDDDFHYDHDDDDDDFFVWKDYD